MNSGGSLLRLLNYEIQIQKKSSVWLLGSDELARCSYVPGKGDRRILGPPIGPRNSSDWISG